MVESAPTFGEDPVFYEGFSMIFVQDKALCFFDTGNSTTSAGPGQKNKSNDVLCKKQKKIGRHDWSRTNDLHHVKVAL